MNRFELLEKREKEQTRKKRLRAEYASKYRSLYKQNGKFRELVGLKRRLEL